MTYPAPKFARNLLLAGAASAALAGCSLQSFDQYAGGGAGGSQGGDTTSLPNNTAGTHTLTDNTPDAGTGGTGDTADAGTPSNPGDPVYSDAGVGQNIVADPGFESGALTGWSCWASCQIALNDEIACYQGSQCLKATDRPDVWHGPAFDIKDLVQPGRPYEVRVQVASSVAAQLQLTLKRLCLDDTASVFDGLHAAATENAQQWTEFVGTFYAPTCTLSSLHILVEQAPKDVNLYLDEFYITLLE